MKVVYEDNHLLVVIKPQNIPSQKDESNDKDIQTMCKEYLKEKYDKKGEVYCGLVHRLDRPTGGLMVFAKTSKCAERHSAQRGTLWHLGLPLSWRYTLRRRQHCG